MASAKAENAAQNCARTRRLLPYTGRSPLSGVSAGEFLALDDLHSCPHAFVSHAAIFVARHWMLARRVERRPYFGDEYRDHHAVHVGPADEKAVHHVGTRHAERDPRIRGHDDALRHEGILLRDDARD